MSSLLKHVASRTCSEDLASDRYAIRYITLPPHPRAPAAATAALNRGTHKRRAHPGHTRARRGAGRAPRRTTRFLPVIVEG